jgi:uncharacterized protein
MVFLWHGRLARAEVACTGGTPVPREAGFVKKMEQSGKNRSESPRANVHPVALTDARWVSGFWGERFALCGETMVPAMGRLMTETERARFIGNLMVAAGEEEGRHRGAKWNDGDFYKWLEAAAAVYAFTRDAELDEQMDRIIDLIGRVQREDGYIHSPVIIGQRNGAGDLEPFTNPMHFEMYNMGHLMLTACVHHRATGKTTLLEIARKAGDFLDQEFANPTPEQARHGICPVHLTGLVELYRTTGERRYLELAVRLLDMRDLVTDGDDDNQDRIPFRQQREAVGHAVRATYLYTGAADIYLETGDETLLQTLGPIWDDLVRTKLYITGGCGALYDGASPDGSADQLSITRVHQAFGRPYQLPQSTSHNETCAAIGNLLWNWRMFQITGEARYADVMEQTLYNSVLAGISLDGVKFFYTNTMRNLRPMPVELRWPKSRHEFINCFCCPPNVVRTIAQSAGYAWAVSERGVWCVLYGGSELETSLPDGRRVKLRQETEYPWEGRVRITVDEVEPVASSDRDSVSSRAQSRDLGSPGAIRHSEIPPLRDAARRSGRDDNAAEAEGEREWSLFLRVPGWAAGDAVTVRVNGDVWSGEGSTLPQPLPKRERGKTRPQPGGGDEPHPFDKLRAGSTGEGRYIEVRREWKAGDVVELELPMAVRVLEAHPYVEEARNHVAVMRGPVVYCLESVDLPARVEVMDVIVRADAQFKPRRVEELGGVVVLEGKGVVSEPGDWTSQLYREYQPGASREVDLRLIPYYAWDNRGESEMTVWLPVAKT